MTQKDFLLYASVLDDSAEALKNPFAEKKAECISQEEALKAKYKEFYDKYFPDEIVKFASRLSTLYWDTGNYGNYNSVRFIARSSEIEFSTYVNEKYFSFALADGRRLRNTLPYSSKARDICSESSLIKYKEEYDHAKHLLQIMEDAMPRYYQWLAETKEKDNEAMKSAIKQCEFTEAEKKTKMCKIIIEFEER